MRLLATYIPTVLLVWACLLSGGCTSTELVSSWQKPGGVPQPFHKVVVMAALQRDDMRRSIEDEFVRQFAARGVQAIPGYTLVPEPGEQAPETVKSAVEKTGADAVLLSGLVRVDRRTDISPGYMTAGPAYRGVYGYYSWGWRTYYQPATVYQYDVATLETRLFDVAQSELIWTGRTQTFEASDPKHDITGLARVILDELAKGKLIP